jgi:murein DD-endopeptidase MepM/ murein hydrolase activator NlpD
MICRHPSRSNGIFLFFLLSFTLVCALPLAAQLDPGAQLDYFQDSQGRVIFTATYSGLIPVYLWVEFPQLQNLSSSVPFPRGFVIPPQRESQLALQEQLVPGIAETYELPENSIALFYLEPRTQASTRFQIQFRFTFGAPVDPSTHNYVYLFPFVHGSKHRVTQGFNGAFTHFNENRYAIDFDLDTGDRIYAARGGLVVAVKQDSNRGGVGPGFAADGNFILVYHEDGTFGNYVHLMQNGSVVQVGDRIEAGQHIGFSGATGQASGPHLHFDVRVPLENGRFQSIPIQFLGLEGEPVTPQAGRTYYAVHPGGPPFVPVFGDDLTDMDFAGHSDPVPRTDSIEIRTELIDSTTLVFIRNGNSERFWTETSLNLTNLQSTQGTRIIREIPPLTEVFLTILRPVNPERGWSHRIQYRFRPVF